jgi:Domain of unknown function (DUF4224)
VFLTPEDLERLTGKRRFSAQRRVLDALGIRYVRAATGEPLVRADALDAKAAGKPTGHRWDMIGSVRNLRP